MESIVTPINVPAYEALLKQSGYDRGKINYLVQGFTKGFSLEYTGPRDQIFESQNIPLSVGSPTELWNKVMKEVQLKRFAGPFKRPVFKYYTQSPIGLVSKNNGRQTHLIFHLSYEFGKMEKERSINFHTPERVCSVKYMDLDYAVKCSLHLLNRIGHGTIFYSKSDLQSTFKIVPCQFLDYSLLTMKLAHPVTKEILYFHDKNLPFSHSYSCALFQHFSDSLHHIVQYFLNRNFSVVAYLDDYLFIAESERICNERVSTFLSICNFIGCPVSLEKTEKSYQENNLHGSIT